MHIFTMSLSFRSIIEVFFGFVRLGVFVSFPCFAISQAIFLIFVIYVHLEVFVCFLAVICDIIHDSLIYLFFCSCCTFSETYSLSMVSLFCQPLNVSLSLFTLFVLSMSHSTIKVYMFLKKVKFHCFSHSSSRSGVLRIGNEGSKVLSRNCYFLFFFFSKKTLYDAVCKMMFRALYVASFLLSCFETNAIRVSRKDVSPSTIMTIEVEQLHWFMSLRLVSIFF